MARLAKNHPTSRLNLELGEAARQKLEALRDRTQANSLTEVVQRALAVYEFLHAERAKGNALVVKDSHGGEKEVVLL
jgi:hypothetical protein